ncbi:InlB B-repeat-containing protein [uncultured Holdemanella sp.]|uniref:InlB B-repeat-containing protein n=2 Tax=Holdemanella TaxID=1573535 RepID=UPI0025E5E491|nr:InlB B-repeat-containing protein [uncultured Holdemanella sp.]
MLKNLKRAAAIVLSFAMAIQFGLANSYYVNAEEEPVEPQQEQTTTVENNSEVQEEDANEVATPETKSVELSYVAEDGTILQAATYRDFDLNYGLNTDSSVMLNFDGYTLKDVIVNNSQTVSADQASLSVTSDLASVQFVYKKVITETENQTTEPCKTEEKNEDDAEADPNPETEVKEELPEYPAFDQSEMAGDVVVHATAAEGVLPRDSKLVVKRITRKAILNAVEETVSEKNMEVESAVALDVTIQSKDGVEIQPNGFVNISFENVATTAQETNVYHVTNDASTVTEVATNAQSFDADHFSIYVITNENQVPLTTFNFVANGTKVSTQIVKSGDTLIAPTAPDMIGQAFVGWVDEAGNSFTGFGKQAEITETTTRTITARYEAALYVYFLNPDGSQIMRTEKVGDHKAHNFTAVSYEVDSTHKLVGWAAEANGTTNIADKISVPADQTSVNVYAIIKEGYWVSFNSDGGSIVDSQFVLHGDNLVLDKSTTPTKPGYSFDGWYNGLTKVENGATVTSPMTLTAHWKAAKVSYTVIHWWENADNDEYSFHESQELQGLTGATTTAAAKSYTIKGKNIHGEDTSDKVFTATTIEQKTIKGDGSTIVNVYYKRKMYTMHFKERSNSRKDYTTITKKWGQSISKEEWPTYDGNGNWQISSSRYLAFTSSMPMKDSTLWSTSGYYTHKAYYYVRNIEDTNYELHHTDVIKSSSYYLTIGKEDCYAITGFTYSHGNPGVDGEYNNSKFYYTRNSYSLRFINNGKQDKTVSKKYEQSISNENYTPARPSSLPDYYEFDGWYDNELCEGEKYVFNGKTMPAQNVTLYAKWTAKKISLTYNLNNPEGDVVKGTKKVAAGTIASTVLPSASAIEGYSFAGWYVADENGHMTNVAFNANDAILRDTNVIGKWLYNGKLTVKYVADGVEAPKDNNVYAGGAKATVANGVTKEGKKFLGWQLDGNNVYQPGQNFEVNKDLADDKNVITLTAVFGDSETSAILNYHRGNGNGEDQSDAILNNVEVTLKSTSDLSYTAPGEDYYFAGWATSMEDAQKGNAKYAVGDKVRVNADSSNDLYATWVKKTVIEVTANSNTLQYNGEEQNVEGFKNVTAGYEVTGLKAEAKGTNFGTYDTVITGTARVTKDGVDVTDKVIVNVNKGTLTISKREVTLTSQTDSKPYDGTPLTRPDVTITGGFVKDEVKEVKATGSVTNVSEGEVTNTITYETSDKFNSENYSITKAEGKLSITPVTDEVTVTIKGNSKTTPYNGTDQSVGGYTVESISNTLYKSTDFTLNGQATATGKDANTYQMNLDANKFVNNNTNFSNVKFEIAEDGQLVISPRAVTLTSETDSKPYDGTPLTRPNVKIEGNFVDGEVTKVEATGSVTYVSEGEVVNTIVIAEGENFKATNYSITKNEGKLSITEVDAEVIVTIKGHEDSVTYDGNPHSVEGYEITDISNKLYTKDDVQFTGEAKAEGTEAGTYQMHLTKDLFSNKNSNFKKVTFVVEDGSLIINRKSIDDQNRITVTKPEDSKYNGEEHKNKPTVTDTKTGKTLVEGTDYTLAYSDDVTNAGTVTVTIKGIGNYSGKTTTNYQILKRDVTLTSGSASRVYNKEALTNGEVTVSGDGFATNEGATYTVTGSQTEVGESKNTFTYELKSNTTASNYNITKAEGKLIVTAEDGEVVVTITGHSDSVEYDGNEKAVSGYDVTITEGSTYTTNDFTFSGNAEVKGTEAGTYHMNLVAEQFTNTNANYEKVRFVVNDGTLTITPKSINPDDEKTGIKVTDPEDSIYDGNEHINGLTVADSKLNTTLVEDTDYTLTYSGDLINVGTVTITIKGIGNYTGEFTKTYQILPREYTVTTNTDSKVYDGNPLTAGGTVNNLVYGETVEFTITGSQTNVGTSDNTYELKFEGTAKAKNYTHGKDSIGTLTITKKSIVPDGPDTPDEKKTGITVTDPEGSKYDGEEHKNKPKVEDTKTKATLKEGKDYELSYSEDVTNAGTVTVTVTGIGNYEGSFEVTYEITKRHVTLTSADDEKVYEGSALTNDTVTVGGDKFAKKEGATYNVTGNQTEVGSSENTFTYELKSNTTASNYNIEVKFGELKVTPFTDKVTVTIKGHEDTATYDGNPHSVEGYEVTNISNKLYKENDIGFTGEAKAEGTKAGTYQMNLTAQQFSNISQNFTNVEFVVEDGSLTINPKSITPDGPNTPEEKKTGITVTAPEGSKYDGEEHRNKPTVTDTKTGKTLVEGKDYTLAYSDDVTNAGTVTVTVTGIGNYEGSFEVTYEITKRNVTLTSGSASKVYDKTALTNDTVTVSGEGFAKDEGATYKVTGSRTKVGTSKNTFTYELKSNTKASNYNIEVKFGDLIVTAEDGEVVVTITGHSDSVEYDGNEKSVSGYDVAITEGSKYTTDDFIFNGTAEAKGTEAGTYSMGLNADQFTNTNDNYTQVTFIVNDGSLTITPKSITPDGPDTPKEEKTGITVTDPEDSIYDGNEHINGLTVADSKLNTTLVEDTDYTLTYSGDLINVGTVTITIKGIGNYTGEFTKTYQILPREYTVTTNTDSKVYDGNPLTAGGTVNNLVKDETVNLTMTGSQTNVGTSDNTYELSWTGSAKEKNYTHGKDSIGTLTVKAKSIVPDGPNTPDEKKTGITVTDPKDSKYDGEEHKNKPKVEDTKTKATLKEGTDYELSYSEDVTNAGTVTVTVTGIGNYEGSFEVTYEITKRHVTLTSADDEKVYDGSALTNDTVTVGGDKFAKKEGATYNVTGMQIEKGSSKNTFTYTLNEGTLAGNYDIETFEGTLKVTAFENEVVVTIKGNKDTVTYDGNPHSVEGYVITDISNKLYKAEYIGVKGYARAEGTAAGTYKMNLTAQQFSNTSASFDKVTFKVEDGALTISPKSITPDGPDTPDEKKTGITVTKPSDSKYDGEEHKNKPTVTDTKTNRTLVEGTDYTLSYSEDVINVGTVTVTVKGIGNYEGSFEVTYEITKRNVTLTSGSASKVYDKTALTKDEVTVSGDGFAKNEGATYNVTGSRTKVGTSDNTFTYELKSNTTASNYNIEVKFGELKVTAEDGEVVVTITGHSDSVEYDGNEKAVSGYDVTITEGSTYTTDDFTFSGTAEAKGTEAGTYSMGLNADQFTNTNDNYTQVTFIVNDGSLTITPKSITPDGPDTPKEEKTGITVTDPEDSIYDGNEHINGLTVADSKLNTTLVEDTDYTLTYSGDLINVGTVTITIKGIGNYTGEFTKTYKITPREYTVTTNTDSKVFDGTALTAGGTVNNLVKGETVGFTITGSQTNVGTSDNTYELNWTGTAKETNYKHGKDSIGKLTVTRQSIVPDPEHPETYKEVTITSPSDEVYDGKEHKWIPTVTDKEGNELVAKTDYEVTYSTTDFTNVTGTITVTITGIGNYTGKATRTYSITPKTYTVTTESDSKVYDGTALTAGGKVSGIVKGETVDFTITGSQTNVGTSDNTYELNWTGSAKESNYKHGKDSIGTLTVKAKSIVPDGPDTPKEEKTSITVSDPSDSKYDGKEHREVLTVQDTKTNEELVAEKDYSVTYSDDLVNAGTVTITIEGIGNYTGSFTKTYEITKRSVTLTSATASKTYDGRALTSTSITVSGDGFVKGEGATYNVTGTQTEVGNSANSFEYKLNENTLASNYDITKVVGTLTITAAPAPVIPAPTPRTPSVPQVITPVETVEKEETPKAEEPKTEKVEEEYTPKASPQYYWALINLICAILTVLFGLLLLISKRHKDEDDEEEDDETKEQVTNKDDEDKEQEQEKKRGTFTRVLAVLIAIASVVFFLVTEDLSLPWTWTDQWTIWMVVLGLVQIVVFFVGRKWKNVDNDDDDEEAQQA